MPRFRIDCGNSNTGPVGFVAVVEAASKEEALATFRDQIPDTVEISRGLGQPGEGMSDSIEYFNVYLNGDGISIEDVEEDED